jgi:Cu/Ag efflux protein CusF
MLKKFSFLVLVAIFALSVGYIAAQSSDQGAQPDQGVQQEQQQQQSPAMKNQQISGVVEKINLEKRTITVKDAVTNQSKDYDFSDATLFSKGAESASDKDLKKGDKVVLEVDNQNMVATVRITPETQTPKN